MLKIIDIEYVIQPQLIDGKLVLSVQTRSQNASVHLKVTDEKIKEGGIEWIMSTLSGMEKSLTYQVENDMLIETIKN